MKTVLRTTFWTAVALCLLATSVAAVESTRTFSGDYVSAFQSGRQPLTAVFTPTGDKRWDVVFHFKFHGKKHAYVGTAEGSLDGGTLGGNVKNESGQRTFTFEGRFRDGAFRGTHAELKRTGERRTGSLTMAEER